MAGRPSEYSEEIQTKAENYISEYKKEGDLVPSIEGLAGFLGVTKQTLYNWAEANKPFLDTLGAIKDLQARLAMNGGLGNVFNATISKLLLANHGYSDKTETDLTTKGDKITPDNQAQANEAIIKYLNDHSGNPTNKSASKDSSAVSVQD